MKLDHIFICTQNGAPEGELLKSFGLTEGSPNEHPGQGTANRRFFFQNTMLELLWLRDAHEAQSDLTRPTGLYERCAKLDMAISPFGFCFRPNHESETCAPFAHWIYKPVYLPAHWSIEVGEAPLQEPMWFFLPFLSASVLTEKTQQQPKTHKTGFKELSSVTVFIPDDKELSKTGDLANQVAGFNIHAGEQHLLELHFDGVQRGSSQDFRPALPLIIRW